MLTLLVMSPRTGARLRVTNDGIADAGVVYTFDWVPRPITIADDADIPATWQRFGLELRHSGAIDLLITPIVDSIELVAQQFALTLTDPGGERRQEVSGRFFQFGTKCTARVQTNTLPALFNIDGAWFEGAPVPNYHIT